MHNEAYFFVQRAAWSRPLPGSVLELGSYFVNGTARGIFLGARYMGVDVRPGSGVDLVMDAADPGLPERVGSFEAVVCMETLEHAAGAEAIIRNARLCCQDAFYLTTAGPAREPHSVNGDAPGEQFYRNVDQHLLDGWLRDAGFRNWASEYGRQEQDIYAVAFV